MTITSTTNKISYTADGVQDTYAYDFQVDDAATMVCTIDGSVISPSNYTVNGVGNPAGGDVVFSGGNEPGPGNLILSRQVPLTQEIDYIEGDPFPAETHEGALDKLTMIDQQQDELISRAPLSDPNEPSPDYVLQFGNAANRASKLWGFDPTGLIVLPVDTAEDKAYRWAESNIGVVVENRDGRDRFSAYHWASVAQDISGASPLAKGEIFVGDDVTQFARRLAPAPGDGYRLESFDAAVDGSGIIWALDPGQLPSLSPGDKLKILQVNVAETGYELTEQFGDTVVHAKDMVQDDESTPSIKTAVYVSHYKNTAVQFDNPGANTYRAWINGLLVRRIDQVAYQLRLRIAKDIDTPPAGGDVSFVAESFIFPAGGGLDPAALVTTGIITATPDDDPKVGQDLIFPALFPVTAGDADVLASVSITRQADSYAGKCNVIAATLELA